jgi:hypothetical protein
VYDPRLAVAVADLGFDEGRAGALGGRGAHGVCCPRRAADTMNERVSDSGLEALCGSWFAFGGDTDDEGIEDAGDRPIADVELLAFELADEAESTKPVVARMVAERAVAPSEPARGAVASSLRNRPPGRSTRLTSPTGARQLAMWWMIPTSKTASKLSSAMCGDARRHQSPR